jgi:hypothetical protein
MVELEQNSWFIDILAKSQEKEDTKRGKNASAANLFDLDAQSTKTMHAKNDVVELDSANGASLSSAPRARGKKIAVQEGQGLNSQNASGTNGDSKVSVSGDSVDVSTAEKLDEEEQDSSRMEPAGHEDATGLREGYTPPSVGVRFTQDDRNVTEQISPEEADQDVEMSSTASAAGQDDEVADRGG